MAVCKRHIPMGGRFKAFQTHHTGDNGKKYYFGCLTQCEYHGCSDTAVGTALEYAFIRKK